jgi:hypothetical protein
VVGSSARPLVQTPVPPKQNKTKPTNKKTSEIRNRELFL